MQSKQVKVVISSSQVGKTFIDLCCTCFDALLIRFISYVVSFSSLLQIKYQDKMNIQLQKGCFWITIAFSYCKIKDSLLGLHCTSSSSLNRELVVEGNIAYRRTTACCGKHDFLGVAKMPYAMFQKCPICCENALKGCNNALLLQQFPIRVAKMP